MTRTGRLALTLGIVLALVAGGAVVLWNARLGPSLVRSARLTKTKDDLRTLAQFWIGENSPAPRPLRFEGKRFVLYLLLHMGARPPADEHPLEGWFSRFDTTRSVARAGGVGAFRALTLAKVADRSFDPDPFTSFLGPRSGVVETGRGVEDVPLLGDLSPGDGAIVVFSNANAKFLTREELGLVPGDPLVAGPASKSPILRALSDR